jgi:hypothetical protein
MTLCRSISCGIEKENESTRLHLDTMRSFEYEVPTTLALPSIGLLFRFLIRTLSRATAPRRTEDQIDGNETKNKATKPLRRVS